MKGDTVNIDGQSYRHRDLSLLPPELSLAAAKTVSTDTAIGFQGKQQPLSNFYRCQIRGTDGHIYCSAEQMFPVRKANYVGKDDMAKQLMSEQDPLVIKRLGDSIKIPRDNDWDKVKLQIMQKIVKEKFTQTSYLKRHLIETGDKNLVHATSDRFWGCGHNLYSDDVKNGHATSDRLWGCGHNLYSDDVKNGHATSDRFLLMWTQSVF